MRHSLPGPHDRRSQAGTYDVLFVGTHERQLDDKGRMALPSRWRTEIGDGCYLVRANGQCIEVVPAEIFESEAVRMRERVERGELTRNDLRGVSSSAQFVAIDKQGRVNVDTSLLDYAGLLPLDRVAVVGAFDRMEIWSPDRFRRLDGVASDRMAVAQ